MAVLNSKIMICNGIKLDKTYKNVVNYSESNMLTLCTNNKVKEANHYSFIKHGANSMAVDFTYSECLTCNYMAFQNYDYNNKWFFAFIDSIEFSSPASTIINFTVDVFATWFHSVTVKPCFVVREHVNDDTIGANTIPEGLETGEYIVQSHSKDTYNNEYTIVTGTLITPLEINLSGTKPRIWYYNGIPSALVYSRWDSSADATTFIQALSDAGKAEYMISMFIAPKWLCPYNSNDANERLIKYNTYAAEHKDLGISRISAIDSYSPKNNKLLCFPYCYIALSNAVGQYRVYHQEDWLLNNSNEMVLRMFGVLSGGCSIRAIPLDYKKATLNVDESITVGKFPMLAWGNDLYADWQKQQGVNFLGTPITHSESTLFGGALKAFYGGVSGKYDVMGSGIGGIFSEMTEMYRRTLTPIGLEGSINTADVNISNGDNTVHLYKVTIKSEYAKVIDQFFTKFGYKVTTLKSPNITGRTYWNYVQIGAGEVIGYGNIPADAMAEINKIFQNGVTIWHNHANIGNYNLNNTIVS